MFSSNDIDWPVGTLPWDRFTLPIISPQGTEAAVQLGPSVPLAVLTAQNPSPLHHTVIEVHRLDPNGGSITTPEVLEHKGVLLGRNANDTFFLVEAPRGDAGRWIGKVEWETGALRWIVSNDATNAFPSTNSYGDLAWSCKPAGEERFHLLVQTMQGRFQIDDGQSDWLLPMFGSNDFLYVYRVLEGTLTLMSLDLRARDPLLTASALILMDRGATIEKVWQIATTNPSNPDGKLALFHPLYNRMMLWQPRRSEETVYFVKDSVAAAPVSDGSWVVTTSDRVVRQTPSSDDGIHLRDALAVPVATTSKKWTHLMLIPDGNRLKVRATNLE
ncbi:MAG: hypothetical protein QGI78_05415 [Phycisphaerales bacterium]|nr:hypothetical protein [Phycisphaerales bacterium]